MGAARSTTQAGQRQAVLAPRPWSMGTRTTKQRYEEDAGIMMTSEPRVRAPRLQPAASMRAKYEVGSPMQWADAPVFRPERQMEIMIGHRGAFWD